MILYDYNIPGFICTIIELTQAVHRLQLHRAPPFMVCTRSLESGCRDVAQYVGDVLTSARLLTPPRPESSHSNAPLARA